MANVFIRYRYKKTPFHLPPQWKLLTFAAFEDHNEERDVDALTRKVLQSPIRSTPLKDRLSSSDTVAILIEDQTRSSPKQIILSALLRELDEARIPKGNIRVIVSLGTHRKLSREELGNIYGKDIVETYSFINHDCYAQDLVPVAKLKTGTVIKINREVNEATFKIGIGSIFPHPMNGFGGGGKILFPGVANFDAILEHHLSYSFRAGSGLGVLMGNPFYEEILTLSRKGGLDFIINSVLDSNDRLCHLLCGDPVEAHLAGIELCKRVISMKFQKQAHVTMISNFPYLEGTQIMKPLAPATEITRPGGIIILVVDCTIPFPEDYVEAYELFRLNHIGHLREGVFDLFDNNRCIMEDGAPELNMSMAQALLAQDDFKIILVSDDIPRSTAERLGFLYAEDLNQAFSMCTAFYPDPDVHIVPSGGIILPVLQLDESF